MSDDAFDPIGPIQMLIDGGAAQSDGPPDLSMAPPFVRGMDLSGVVFKSVESGRFDIEWTIGEHLAHYDGFVQGGVVNVVADTGQSFAFATTSAEPETFSTAEFTTRFFRPMKAGDVIDVKSEVLNRSRRLGVVDTTFTNRKTGKICAVVRGSWMVVARDFGAPPNA